MNKIAVGREDFPTVAKRDSTEQHVHGRVGDPMLSAFVTDSGRFLVVRGIELHVWEAAKVLANPAKLRLIANAGKYFLPCGPKQLDPALPDELIKSLCKATFHRREIH